MAAAACPATKGQTPWQQQRLQQPKQQMLIRASKKHKTASIPEFHHQLAPTLRQITVRSRNWTVRTAARFPRPRGHRWRLRLRTSRHCHQLKQYRRHHPGLNISQMVATLSSLKSAWLQAMMSTTVSAELAIKQCDQNMINSLYLNI